MTFVVPLELSASFPAGISVMITVVSGSFDEVISPLAIVFCWLAAGISTAAAAVSTAEISTAETSVPIVSVADLSTGETSVPGVSTGDLSTAETSVPTVSVADISTVSTGDFSTAVTSGAAVSTVGVGAAWVGSRYVDCCRRRVFDCCLLGRCCFNRRCLDGWLFFSRSFGDCFCVWLFWGRSFVRDTNSRQIQVANGIKQAGFSRPPLVKDYPRFYQVGAVHCTCQSGSERSHN